MRSRRTASRTRIVLLALAALSWLGLISYRLFDLQVLRHTELARQVERQHQRTLEVTPKRGTIFDRNGRELAVSLGVESVFAVPSEVDDPAAVARTLARILKADATELEHRLRSSNSFVWLQRKLDAAVAEKVRELGLGGIHFEREHKRFYPKRELAAHVLGFVGLDGDGLGGLEYAFDADLRGAPERVVITADGRRRTYRRRSSDTPGSSDLVLTLDENIQYIAERELAAAVRASRAKSGSIIVQDPSTGEVLAMASYPAFNPNQAASVPKFFHVNRTVSLPYEPGSTFKLVTVAAALEEGLTHPLEIIDCQMGGIVLAGHLIRDWKPFGRLTVREIVYYSSDVGAIKLGQRLGERRFYDHIRRWGFGEKTGIELPAESRGILRSPGKWSRISIGALSMGQEIAVTPVQLTAAISAVANGGEWITPHVVREVAAESGARRASPVERRRIIPEKVADEMRRMFAGVVAGGTGTRARVAGYSAAGKTGTAQKIDETGTYSTTDFIVSFVGFAPVLNPAVTVVVTIDSPQTEKREGGEVAAPVFSRVTEKVLAYLNVPGDLPGLRQRAAFPATAPATADRTADRIAGDASSRWVTAATRPESIRFSERNAQPGVLSPFGTEMRGVETIVTQDGDSVIVPDLSGLALREVVSRCARMGLEPVAAGSGLAVSQSLKAGVRVPRGSRIRIEFRRALSRAPTRTM